MTDIDSNNYRLRFTGWFSNHYMLLINLLLLLFLFFTLAAPAAMKMELAIPAKVMYWFYSKFCHQIAFRSWFVFGQQPYYPRYATETLLSYQEMFGASADNLMTASAMLGNETAGYKIAICQRDFAMYVMLLFTGLIFSITGKRLKRIPLWLWISLGVLPLGLDGMVQLISSGSYFQNWIPVYESTPLVRSITGGLFGLFSGWYIFPAIQSSLTDIEKKETDLKRMK